MYKFERITGDSYNKIRELSKRSFGIDRTELSIANKYNTEMFGKVNIGVLAETKENELAAFYGVFPLVLEYKERKYLVAQSGDTMTAPEHRKKGLFTKLAKLTYAIAEKEGVKAVFGFPNENSYPGFKNKLNWIFTGAMQRFRIRVRTIPFCEASNKYKFWRPVYRSFFKARIRKYNIVLSEENIKHFRSNQNVACIKKDLNYFKYKLLDSYNRLIRINGFLMLVKTVAHLQIGVVGYFEKHRTEDFLQVVKRLSRRMGCRDVIFIMSQNHWLFDYLIEKHAHEESLPIGFYMIDEALDPGLVEFTQSDYDTF